jgi:hypothetical protein
MEKQEGRGSGEIKWEERRDGLLLVEHVCYEVHLLLCGSYLLGR